MLRLKNPLVRKRSSGAQSGSGSSPPKRFVLRLKNPFFTGSKVAEAEEAGGLPEGSEVVETEQGSEESDELEIKAEDRIDSGISEC